MVFAHTREEGGGGLWLLGGGEMDGVDSWIGARVDRYGSSWQGLQVEISWVWHLRAECSLYCAKSGLDIIPIPNHD